MFFRKRKIKIRKYRKKVFETYSPEKRIELSRERAVPFFIRVGGVLLSMGGWIGFFISSLFFGIMSFFGIRKKTRKIFRGKTVEFRIKQKHL